MAVSTIVVNRTMVVALEAPVASVSAIETSRSTNDVDVLGAQEVALFNVLGSTSLRTVATFSSSVDMSMAKVDFGSVESCLSGIKGSDSCTVAILDILLDEASFSGRQKSLVDVGLASFVAASMGASTEREVGLAVIENFHEDSLLVERFGRWEACKVTVFGNVAILYFMESFALEFSSETNDQSEVNAEWTQRVIIMSFQRLQVITNSFGILPYSEQSRQCSADRKDLARQAEQPSR
jgi:hypothetical protein